MLAAALLSRYFKFEAGFHIRVHPHRYYKLAQFLDWFGEQNPAPVDADSKTTQRTFDVDIGDRAEKLAAFASAGRDLDGQLFQPLLNLQCVRALGFPSEQGQTLFVLKRPPILGIGFSRPAA